MKLSEHIDRERKNGGKVTDLFFGVIRYIAYAMFVILVIGEIYR